MGRLQETPYHKQDAQLNQVFKAFNSLTFNMSHYKASFVCKWRTVWNGAVRSQDIWDSFDSVTGFRNVDRVLYNASIKSGEVSKIAHQ